MEKIEKSISQTKKLYAEHIGQFPAQYGISYRNVSLNSHILKMHFQKMTSEIRRKIVLPAFFKKYVSTTNKVTI